MAITAAAAMFERVKEPCRARSSNSLKAAKKFKKKFKKIAKKPRST